MHIPWIEVDGIENVPEGLWLVEVDADRESGRYHVADVNPNISIIGNHFAFDMEKVIKYKELDI